MHCAPDQVADALRSTINRENTVAYVVRGEKTNIPDVARTTNVGTKTKRPMLQTTRLCHLGKNVSQDPRPA